MLHSHLDIAQNTAQPEEPEEPEELKFPEEPDPDPEPDINWLPKAVGILALAGVGYVGYSYLTDDMTESTKIAHYTVFADGTAVDNNTELMWARCSVGQTWQNGSCVGEAEKYTWEDAFSAIEQLNKDNYLGYSDWRLPHIEELHSLLYCNTGFASTYIIPSKAGDTKTVKEGCKGNNYQRPTIHSEVLKMPNALYLEYWSSSPYAGNSDYAWYVYFGDGYANNYNKGISYHVRAVRSK